MNDGFEYYTLSTEDCCKVRTHTTFHRAHSNPAFHNSTDLAMPPAHGFHPPKLSIPKDPNGAVRRSVQPSPHTPRGEGSRGRMLTTRDLMAATAAELVSSTVCICVRPESPVQGSLLLYGLAWSNFW